MAMGWLDILGKEFTGWANCLAGKKKVLESFGSEDPKAKSLQNSKLGGVLWGRKCLPYFRLGQLGWIRRFW
jgi:hypothetical protein